MSSHRIATVKATGEKFLVVNLDFRGKRCLCWGQLVSFTASRETGRVLSTRHAAGRSWPLAEVEIAAEQVLTKDLAKQLLRQAERAALAARPTPTFALGSLDPADPFQRKLPNFS